MSNELVQYSRAGDVFHYRWAARRCLQLVYPHAKVKEIVIEGSKESTLAGEYVIDVTEYSENASQRHIHYYQLKHSTIQVNAPFTLSDLQHTVSGFAKRYTDWFGKKETSIAFSVITNRKIADSFKIGVSNIAQGKPTGKTFKSTIEKYTGLTGDKLRLFCEIFYLHDGEGDHNVQQEELQTELSKIAADQVDPVQVNNLVSMVQEKVLPKSRKTVVREDVLNRFGIKSERQLYSAPPQLEPATNFIELSHYQTLKESIASASGSVIIHAEGGVGKSVFCRHVVDSLPNGSVGIVYDCFGSGKYRNRGQPRHGHRHALTQIINELAAKGLCSPLILFSSARDEDFVRYFHDRVKETVEGLRKIVPSANLVILIDAADNAEMAADELNETCFAHELIREQMPTGCQLVFLCRTERIHLLKPSKTIRQLQLHPFSESETLRNLRSWFPTASEHDGYEFHRLTNANPRVQANALTRYHAIDKLLESLGPGGMSNEKLIESQLSTAVEKIKDELSEKYQQQIDAICLSLAILPPHIPIDVLSRASHVDESTVKSFVSHIGRSLWLLDSSVQFRDEPTETWFKETFSGKPSDYEVCIALLEPQAHQSTYIAEVLPQLYLQAGQYEKLIQVSLTDELLPSDNPIDARTIRVYRLQFAFKAALKTKKTADAIRVAIRAGEEVAGNQRQLNLLRENIELLVRLQSKEKVQEIAFKQELTGQWDGSQDIYTASLLSGIKEYQGEARGYLRSGLNWFRLALEEKTQSNTGRLHNESRILQSDFVETAYATLNLHGAKSSIDFLAYFNPMYVMSVLKQLTDRLMDEGRFAEIDDLAIYSKGHVHNTVGIGSVLIQLGKIPDRSTVSVALDQLCDAEARIKKPDAHHFDRSLPRTILAFAECCVASQLSSEKILQVLDHYLPTRADRGVVNDRLSDDRSIFLKSLSIRLMLSGRSEPDFKEILPQDYLGEKISHDVQNEVTEFKEGVLGLLPWYLFRARILKGEKLTLLDGAREAQQLSNKGRGQRYRSRDYVPEEIALICSSILVFLKDFPSQDVQGFYESFLKPTETLPFSGKLTLLNAAGRLGHLSFMQSELENTSRDIVKSMKGDGPDAISSRYLALARAVLTVDPKDARVYFDYAIEVASKFGDEIMQRWEALVGLAEQASHKGETTDILAYRFIRCAEVVGEAVDGDWNRSEAMRVCTKMSPGVGLSTTSRWRDRDIGIFKYELIAAVDQLLTINKIDSAMAWSMACFFHSSLNQDFIIRCLSKTSSSSLRKKIIEDVIRWKRMDGVEPSYWGKIKSVADEWIADAEWRTQTFSFLREVPDETQKADSTPREFQSTDYVDWDEIFKGLEMLTADGFSELVDRHVKAVGDDSRGNPTRLLLTECVNRLRPADLEQFIDTLIASRKVGRYDLQGVLENVPAAWRRKVSFASTWSSVIRKFAESYASELCNSYGFDSFIRAIKADENLQNVIIEGINVGLIGARDINDGELFFAYAKLSALRITDAEASRLLDYAVERFELHIDTDTGDGEWSPWLEVTGDIHQNLSGVIWSTLGSPRARERWNAAHCVRMLIELDCAALLAALMMSAEKDTVGAFGSKVFPFYDLHARQYLVIALARASMDYPSRLVEHVSLLKKFALESEHILLQKFARDTCISIEAKFPGTFDQETRDKLSTLIESKFPVRNEKRHEFRTQSYWHENNLIDENIEYHFAWDFDRYWYQPLGEVFGISGKHVQDLAAFVLTKEWGINKDEKNKRDPRAGIWNRYPSDRETSHDHGSYPKADDLDFYRSYHAMFVVASRLLQTMPVLSSSYDDRSVWASWLSRHLLTRADGKWLADHRDSVPLVRPSWVSTEHQGFPEWKSLIHEDDFFNVVKSENGKWITAKGGWHEKKSDRVESFYISSACVSKTTSDALLRAWMTATDHHDYKVPDFMEDDMEFESDIFSLTGWIVDPNNEHELDEYDPYANKVEYPSYKIGQSILDALTIRSDAEGKKWFNEMNECIASCSSWVSAFSYRDEEADQAGMRLCIDLSTAKRLCKELNCELIFKVAITRRHSYAYRAHLEERDVENEQHRIFILNEHGQLRTIGKSYQLG